MRVVVDTNVLVSGLFSPAGAPGQIVDALLQGWLIPLVSDVTLAELEDVLTRPVLRRWFERAGIDPTVFLNDYRALAQRIRPRASGVAIRDEKDRAFLELAEGAPAGTCLITGDRDFHALTGTRFQVIAPAAFVSAFISPAQA